MRNVTFAVAQFACSWDREANVAKAKEMVRAAAAKGANVVLLQELFATPYFCQDQSPDHFKLAAPVQGNPLIAEMTELAWSLNVVLPVSFFEQAGRVHFNSLAMIDADGKMLGVYRKSHFRTGRAIRRNTTSRPAIRVFGSGARALAFSAPTSAGTNGSPKPRARWH